MVSSLAVFAVLASAFTCMFALMWGLQRTGRYAHPVIHGLRPAGARGPVASALGPDDDAVFLRELRRRIDLGHFRH